MIREVQGDILLSKAQLVAHGVAPNDDFATGLALALRERWPSMYKDFRHYCRQSHPKSGQLWSWGGPGVRLVSLFTQEAAYGHGGRPGRATVEYVNHSLRDLRKLIEAEGFRSVALPRVATGVGGLDWKDVKPLVERHLGDLEASVFVYAHYEPGKAADER